TEVGEPLEGTVEVDETYVGGKGKGYHWRPRKAMVLSALQRDARIVMRVGKTHSAEVLKGWVAEAVSPEAQNIYTDEAHGYIGIGDENTKHDTVQHSAKEYVRGDVHTNGIEGAFGLFKRSLVGSFHKVSTKHLDRYLDEFEFKYNNRKNFHLFRDTLTCL